MTPPVAVQSVRVDTVWRYRAKNYVKTLVNLRSRPMKMSIVTTPPKGGQTSAGAMTIVEMLISMSIFGMVVAGFIALQFLACGKASWWKASWGRVISRESCLRNGVGDPLGQAVGGRECHQC